MSYTPIHIGLCGGRHPIVTNDGESVDEFVFPNAVENPLDFESHRQTVFDYLRFKFDNDTYHHRVHLYVTGLTPLLTAFLHEWFRTESYWMEENSLILMHYDRDSEQYKAERWYGNDETR